MLMLFEGRGKKPRVDHHNVAGVVLTTTMGNALLWGQNVKNVGRLVTGNVYADPNQNPNYHQRDVYNGVKAPIDFYVVDVDKQVILGLKASLTMKLVTVNCNLQVVKDWTPINDTKDLTRLYPDRFKGIGQFKGDYHIVIHKEALPVVYNARRCPIHIQEEIKKELDEMVKLDVIASVEEPNDWVSSLAYTQKPNGRWRICLDPRDLNKVIKRTHHRITDHRGDTHKFSGAKVFSKLDAKHGYCRNLSMNHPVT
ncbi:hypothetical protein BSL78_26733 [Apostichopus japonicus]|uniref:Uncharacterized protein n=1 Tax=Stichopus japonicus TaxID=307972 RepID=A0A2G8JL32_STIJA|nr:hypothetical protein BSL78_26733 [Apostichopus japonicus]